ncbi:MAG: alkaline shock response membrane anchor protein AmaP [Clostridia bacterium]|nr:alkaline shock response membrane anchor protein AmaP [Clostridia bacterium]
MNRLVRVLMIAYSFLMAVLGFLFFIVVLDNNMMVGLTRLLYAVNSRSAVKAAVAVLFLTLFVLGILTLVYSLLSGRMRKSRLRRTDIGTIDIGVDAIESIALNSAKSAQGGIKTAKARVYSSQNEKINVELTAVLYSDVEIPVMMAKVQDRIKKDIERFTGIPVSNVYVKVSRVEPVAARIER